MTYFDGSYLSGGIDVKKRANQESAIFVPTVIF